MIQENSNGNTEKKMEKNGKRDRIFACLTFLDPNLTRLGSKKPPLCGLFYSKLDNEITPPQTLGHYAQMSPCTIILIFFKLKNCL